MVGDAALFDALLVAVLVWLAWRLLTAGELFKAAVLFIVFGLLLALAWARLGAPDVALAEAAIGAGLAGALLLDTLARLGAAGAGDDARPLRPTAARLAVVLPVLGLGALLVGSVLALPDTWPGLSAEAARALPNSGVTNPVTATLLNFRAYDTLLEIGVLLLAVIGVWVLEAETSPRRRPAGPVLGLLVRVLTPVLVLVAAYLLWVGAHAPGGAFQGAALLAAGGVLLHVTRPFDLPLGRVVRAVVGLGFGVFLLVGATLLLVGGGFLTFPPAQAAALILLIEAAAMLSIALIMVALFVGHTRPPDRADAA